MERDTWQEKFTERLQYDGEAQSAFDFLLKHGCDQSVIEDLLFAIGVQDKLTSGQILDLENDFWITSYILGTALQRLAEDLLKERGHFAFYVPLLAKMIKLDKEMMNIGSNLVSISRDVCYCREMFECGIPLLSVYVRKVTGKTAFERLGALVQSAHLLPPSAAVRLDSVRIAVKRFRKNNPQLWRVLNQTVDALLARGFPIGRDELHTRVYESAAKLPECGHLGLGRPNPSVRNVAAARRYLRRYDLSIGHSHAARLLGIDGCRPKRKSSSFLQQLPR
jgi:hypothetical protein